MERASRRSTQNPKLNEEQRLERVLQAASICATLNAHAHHKSVTPRPFRVPCHLWQESCFVSIVGVCPTWFVLSIGSASLFFMVFRLAVFFRQATSDCLSRDNSAPRPKAAETQSSHGRPFERRAQFRARVTRQVSRHEGASGSTFAMGDQLLQLCLLVGCQHGKNFRAFGLDRFGSMPDLGDLRLLLVGQIKL